ncbi:MAG: hypothetical protein J7L15_08165 [Clostridiales bacterium]|nr:hypothetical protein [Clostridiales bacterium]
MKKTSFFIILAILSMGIMSGCSAKDDFIQEETSAIKIYPSRKAEVYGMVQTIIGNEVTINLAQTANAGLTEANELTEEEKEAKRAERQASGGNGGMGANKEIVLTGKTLDVVIPVGTPIYLSGAATSEPVKIEIADIIKSTVIKVWLIDGGEGEVNLAEFIQVIDR